MSRSRLNSNNGRSLPAFFMIARKSTRFWRVLHCAAFTVAGATPRAFHASAAATANTSSAKRSNASMDGIYGRKRGGDISSGFVSLSSGSDGELPQRFAETKRKLVSGYEQEVRARWRRLLDALKKEVAIVEKYGSSVIPEIAFADLPYASSEFKDAVKKRGTCIIRGVMPEQEARSYKHELDQYVKANPSTQGMHASSSLSSSIVRSQLNSISSRQSTGL